MKNIFNKNKTGFTVVEVLVACAIMSLVSIALMSTASKGIELSSRALRQTQANMLLEEGAEAVKSIRGASWDNISSLSGTNYLAFNTNVWSLLPSNPIETIDDIFTRTIDLSEVYRDSNDDINSTGTLDDGSKLVNVTVTWPVQGGISSKNITFYLTDIFN